MNEFGKPTIEEVFHPLSTRLYKLRIGDIEPEDGIYDGVEDYAGRKIKPILAGIFSYDGAKALQFVDNTLTSITELQGLDSGLVKDITDEYLGFDSGAIGKSSYDFKKQALKEIQTELAYYTRKLNELKEQLSRNVPTHNLDNNKRGEQYDLPADYDVPMLKNVTVEKFDRYQSALLFYYLREHGAVVNFSDSSYSKVIACLTGHSAENIRQKALGPIWDVIRDKAKNRTVKQPNYNLNTVKDLLTAILKDIEQEIQTNDSKKL